MAQTQTQSNESTQIQSQIPEIIPGILYFNGSKRISKGSTIYRFTWLTHKFTMQDIGRAACIIVSWLKDKLESGGLQYGGISTKMGSDYYCHMIDVNYSVFVHASGDYILTINDYVLMFTINEVSQVKYVIIEVFINRTAAHYFRKYFNVPNLINDIFGQYVKL